MSDGNGEFIVDTLSGTVFTDGDSNNLDWVIVGGETGHNARPMHPDWVCGIQKQCEDAQVPFFFKSWGEWMKLNDTMCYNKAFKNKQWFNFDPDTSVCKVGKKLTGNKINRVEYLEFPNDK